MAGPGGEGLGFGLGFGLGLGLGFGDGCDSRGFGGGGRGRAGCADGDRTGEVEGPSRGEAPDGEGSRARRCPATQAEPERTTIAATATRKRVTAGRDRFIREMLLRRSNRPFTLA